MGTYLLGTATATWALFQYVTNPTTLVAGLGSSAGAILNTNKRIVSWDCVTKIFKQFNLTRSLIIGKKSAQFAADRWRIRSQIRIFFGGSWFVQHTCCNLQGHLRQVPVGSRFLSIFNEYVWISYINKRTDEQSFLPVLEVIVQPDDSVQIQMVRRLVKHQKSWL